MTVRRVAIGGVFFVTVLIAAVLAREGRDAQPLPGPPLRALAAQRGIAIGTAVRGIEQRNNRAYRELIAEQFSSVTPENEMKWYALEPDRGRFTYNYADMVVDSARKAGQQVRGHALVWFDQLPRWLIGLGSDELRAATENHIRQVMGHYAGRVGVWDVVNEAILDHGGLRRSPFLDKLGPGYIGEAFKIAHAADPKAKLFINEIGAEGINAKSDRLYEIARGLKASGAPIDGVGFQAHLNLRGVPATFVDNMRRFEALGLEIHITEADVALRLPVTAGKLRGQAGVYRRIVDDCLAVKACKSLTFWGFTDGRSWIPETQPGMGAATLLDEQLKPKPAFFSVQRALGG
ncbi:MAG: endo,4-beta-xylanase [Solirubrobacteraceae bacterium]|nr:endo,4-beta-xylanase [Solirubrobacteraceae bacterium]